MLPDAHHVTPARTNKVETRHVCAHGHLHTAHVHKLGVLADLLEHAIVVQQVVAGLGHVAKLDGRPAREVGVVLGTAHRHDQAWVGWSLPKSDFSGVGCQHAINDTEQGAFTSAIGANNSNNGALEVVTLRMMIDTPHTHASEAELPTGGNWKDRLSMIVRPSIEYVTSSSSMTTLPAARSYERQAQPRQRTLPSYRGEGLAGWQFVHS